MNASTSQFSVNQKVIVITGGYGTLAGCMTESLGKEGAKIALLGRNEEKIKEKVQDLQLKGIEALGLVADVLKEGELARAKDQLLNTWNTVDVLINAAGGNMAGATIGPDQTIFDLSINDFKKVTDLNLSGSVLPSLVFGKMMADKKSGVIINVSSMTAQQAITRVVGYSASKAAIDNFTRWMAVEMATKFGDRVRVNAIAPGFFIGEQNRALLTNSDGSYTDRGNTIINNTPMKRFGRAEELNGAIHWLCSDASSFVTGIVVPIDGGFSAFSGV